MSATDGPTLAATPPADLALIRSIRAWGHLLDQGRDNLPTIFGRFAPAYRDRLIEVWASTSRMTPELAWQTLFRDQYASSRYDPSKVHPSWFVRIFEAESPAVQWTIAQHAPEPIRTMIERRFVSRNGGRDRTDPRSATTAPPPNPEAIQWALTFWAERLVGDVAESPNDPPIILALSQFSIKDLSRLVRVIGQAKYAFSLEGSGPERINEPSARLSATDRVRIGFFRRTIGRADPRLIPIARADFASSKAESRRKFAAVGLITVARLLKACDTHRARWAVQHIPYPVARRFGSIAGGQQLVDSGLSTRAIRAWESWILEAAWARLLSEGRLGSGQSRARS